MEDKNQQKSSIFEFVKFILITAIVIIPIRLWIAQPFLVSGASMETTYKDGDYLIVDELTYHFKKPEKNDVIIFRYPKDPSKFFIKRIIGLPGETVEINGQKTKVSENEYYVLGDNRDASSDSRIWGTVPEKLIIGRSFVRLWPINKIKLFPGY